MAGTLADILRRFRPAVAPGGAAAAGVPADRVAEAEAELAAVFVALRPAVDVAAETVRAARADAERRRREAVDEAQRILAEARGRIDAVRSAAAGARLAELDAERAAMEAEARAEAERVAQAAAGRLPGLVAGIVDGLRGTPPGVGEGPHVPEEPGAGTRRAGSIR